MNKSISTYIDVADIFMLLGLLLIGVGLFFWFNVGVSLTIVGTLLLSLGYFGGVKKKSR